MASPARGMDARTVEVLGKLSSEDVEKFVHAVIDGVCDKQGPRYETFAKSLSLAHFSRLVRCFEAAVKAVGREGGSKEQIIQQLSSAGLSEEVCKVIGQCVSVRSEEVRTQLLRDSAKVSPSSLTDFDWKLKLVMSSDKLGAIQKPVLNLDLDIVENGRQRMESIELSQQELERVISSLEAANKVYRQPLNTSTSDEGWLAALLIVYAIVCSFPLALAQTGCLTAQNIARGKC